jgi:hypothetical protein
MCAASCGSRTKRFNMARHAPLAMRSTEAYSAGTSRLKKFRDL